MATKHPPVIRYTRVIIRAILPFVWAILPVLIFPVARLIVFVWVKAGGKP